MTKMTRVTGVLATAAAGLMLLSIPALAEEGDLKTSPDLVQVDEQEFADPAQVDEQEFADPAQVDEQEFADPAQVDEQEFADPAQVDEQEF
ncbi:hypothetical protein, partial [Streptomyces sp. NPDC004546]|uniref:hypothetical protein n=1 Tax=Streptomyces sp. NPDC004546 TaxID=3154282 RepID=UPI0033B6D99F